MNWISSVLGTGVLPHSSLAMTKNNVCGRKAMKAHVGNTKRKKKKL